MSAAGSPRSFQRAVLLGAGVAVLLLAGLLLVSARQPVRLAGITPADGSALERAPQEVALSFTGDDFRPGSVYLQVNGPDGTPVTDGPPRLDGRRLVAPLRTDARGGYRVVYRLVLDGGREVAGTTGFDVGPAARPGTAPVNENADAHNHAIDGAWNLLLLVVDAVLLPGAVLLMLRGPRLRRARPGGRTRAAS
ncbi:copper resistance protein CopC [Kitasatospora sp. NPDC059646]|uniref:copper resistance CopC family protein n=1 Tax=Kitasatospora sp. NPDC059646 TaxID=3346893 RepID=UPI0036B0C61B